MKTHHPSGMHNPFQTEKKKSPKILSTIEAGRSADGGFEMKHRFSGFEHDPETHSKPDGHAALKHMAKHMGINDVDITKKAAQPPAAAPAPEPQPSQAEEAAEGE